MVFQRSGSRARRNLAGIALFGFGEDSWNRVNVEAGEDRGPRGKVPKVIKRVGKSPPQYADEDD